MNKIHEQVDEVWLKSDLIGRFWDFLFLFSFFFFKSSSSLFWNLRLAFHNIVFYYCIKNVIALMLKLLKVRYILHVVHLQGGIWVSP